MQVNIRKLATYVETFFSEGGKEVNKPIKIAAAMAVINNPYGSQPFKDDLSELIDTHCSVLGELLAAEVTKVLGEEVEAYGKGALVGTAGEIEHGSAIIHSLKFGNPFRNLVNGTSLLPAAEKRGVVGSPIDLALKHKNDVTIRSHHQTFEVRIPDAPLPDEIIVIVTASSSGRPHARIGNLQDDIK